MYTAGASPHNAKSDYSINNIFVGSEIAQKWASQMHVTDAYPWNECQMYESEYEKEIYIAELYPFGDSEANQIAIPFGNVELLPPCNFEEPILFSN